MDRSGNPIAAVYAAEALYAAGLVRGVCASWSAEYDRVAFAR
jgi:hypothetical protein